MASLEGWGSAIELHPRGARLSAKPPQVCRTLRWWGYAGVAAWRGGGLGPRRSRAVAHPGRWVQARPVDSPTEVTAGRSVEQLLNIPKIQQSGADSGIE